MSTIKVEKYQFSDGLEVSITASIDATERDTLIESLLPGIYEDRILMMERFLPDGYKIVRVDEVK